MWAPAALAQTPKRGGVFRVPVPDAPTLDPHLNAGFVTHVYASLVYGQLVRFPSGPEAQGGADHRILPDIAERWEFATPTTVVFRLKKGVRKGARLLAADREQVPGARRVVVGRGRNASEHRTIIVELLGPSGLLRGDVPARHTLGAESAKIGSRPTACPQTGAAVFYDPGPRASSA